MSTPSRSPSPSPSGPSSPSPFDYGVPFVQSGTSQLNTTRVAYTWTIRNFANEMYNQGECIESPVFTSGPEIENEWTLVAYPKGYHSPDFLAVYLVFNIKASKLDECRAKFQIILIDGDGEQFSSENCDYNDSVQHVVYDRKRNIHGTDKYIALSDLYDEENYLLPNGDLKILVQILIDDGVCDEDSSNSWVAPQDLPQTALSQDFSALLGCEELSDVVVAAAGEEFKAHKCVLAARSPVFSAMFTHKMKEKKRNRVDITDLEAFIVKDMLAYIYTGYAPSMGTNPEDLLEAADKYQLSNLKRQCEDRLRSADWLDVDSAARLLVLADTHNADILRDAVITYINNNAPAVQDSEGWLRVEKEHPRVIAAVYRRLALKYVPYPQRPNKRRRYTGHFYTGR